MGNVSVYVLSVCGAALLFTIAGRFLNRNTASAATGRLIIGLFLLLTILRPVTNLYFDEFHYLPDTVQAEAAQAVSYGENLSKETLSKIITERTATYILQKARSLQLDIRVEVYLSDDSLPVPKKIYISGNVAPYPRQQLQNCIEQDLGIPKENQIWT